MNEKHPTVSIVIPTYNRAQILPLALQSVLSQTYQDIEVIIVDDASTDNTGEVVQSIKDERIRYIRHPENKGGSAARNTGIRASRGEFIAFQDSDDEWLQDKLQKQMEAIQKGEPETDIVYTGFYKEQENKRIYIPAHNIKKKEGDILGQLLRENFVATPTVLARKRDLEKVGMFDETLPRYQDWELAIRLAKQYTFRCVDEPLLIAHRVDNSISTNQSVVGTALRIILEKHHDTILSAGKEMLARWYFSVGTVLCQSGDMEEGGQLIARAIKTFPFNPRFWPSFIIVRFLGRDLYMKFVNLYLYFRK